MAVRADDGVDSRHLGCQIGIDVVVDLNTGWVGSEADVGQGDYCIVASPQQGDIGSGYINWIENVSPGMLRGQLVVGNPMVGNAQNSQLDVLGPNC